MWRDSTWFGDFQFFDSSGDSAARTMDFYQLSVGKKLERTHSTIRVGILVLWLKIDAKWPEKGQFRNKFHSWLEQCKCALSLKRRDLRGKLNLKVGGSWAKIGILGAKHKRKKCTGVGSQCPFYLQFAVFSPSHSASLQAHETCFLTHLFGFPSFFSYFSVFLPVFPGLTRESENSWRIIYVFFQKNEEKNEKKENLINVISVSLVFNFELFMRLGGKGKCEKEGKYWIAGEKNGNFWDAFKKNAFESFIEFFRKISSKKHRRNGKKMFLIILLNYIINDFNWMRNIAIFNAAKSGEIVLRL